MKNIIHIFGASGCGTTTLGKKICEQLGYTLMDTDDYFWLPTEPNFTVKRDRDERIKLMTADIQKAENVVISGSLTDWGDGLIPYFTLAVRIEMDQALRIERLIKREIERYGAHIQPGGDRYKQHLAFVEWAKLYDTGDTGVRSKAKHDEWEKLLLCEILYLNGADTVENHFEKVKQILEKQNNQS